VVVNRGSTWGKASPVLGVQKVRKNKDERKRPSGNVRKYDVFEDRAVAWVRLCLGGTSPCVRRVFCRCFARKRGRGPRKSRVFSRFRQGAPRLCMFFRSFCILKSAEAFSHVLPRFTAPLWVSTRLPKRFPFLPLGQVGLILTELC